MPLGSFVSGALATLTVDDLDRMLKLDETLFVEHKSDLKTDGSYNLMKAVASFANTLGGWLLIGVHDGKPIADPGSWPNASGPPLVDQVRDRLRHELDPLPAFEARVLPHPDGPIGVVRVYQSADTPHVAIKTGSVFVREVAGDSDASRPRRAGGGRDSERAYAAAQIRSRAQLIELTERGKLAEQRVKGLVDPLRPLPLTNNALDLHFERAAEDTIQPKPISGGGVVVRLVPYSLPPHFQGWSTTADASAAVLTAVEGLADRHGLGGDWITPHPAGQSVDVPDRPRRPRPRASPREARRRSQRLGPEWRRRGLAARSLRAARTRAPRGLRLCPQRRAPSVGSPGKQHVVLREIASSHRRDDRGDARPARTAHHALCVGPVALVAICANLLDSELLHERPVAPERSRLLRAARGQTLTPRMPSPLPTQIPPQPRAELATQTPSSIGLVGQTPGSHPRVGQLTDRHSRVMALGNREGHPCWRSCLWAIATMLWY